MDCGHAQAFGDSLELLFTVGDESLQRSPLTLCQFGQGDYAALFCDRGNGESELLQHGPSDAELAAALGSLQQLTLARGLVDLPGQEIRVDLSCCVDAEVKERRHAHGMAWRCASTHSVEPGALGGEEDVAILDPVRLLAAGKAGSDRAGPVDADFRPDILHLHDQDIAVRDLFDCRAEGVAGLQRGHLCQNDITCIKRHTAIVTARIVQRKDILQLRV